MPKVYIPNKSFHDFSSAEKFGDLFFLTEGTLPLHSVNTIYRMVEDQLSDSDPDDYILISGPGILTAVMASIMASRHGVVNYLIYDRRNNRYKHERISLRWIGSTLNERGTDDI